MGDTRKGRGPTSSFGKSLVRTTLSGCMSIANKFEEWEQSNSKTHRPIHPSPCASLKVVITFVEASERSWKESNARAVLPKPHKQIYTAFIMQSSI